MRYGRRTTFDCCAGSGMIFDCLLRNLYWAGGSLCLRRVKCELFCFIACRGVFSGCWIIQVKIAHVFSLSRGGDVTRLGESSTPSPFVPEGMSHPRRGISGVPPTRPVLIDLSVMLRRNMTDRSVPKRRQARRVGRGRPHPRSLAEPRDDEGEGGGLESGRRDGWAVCGSSLARPFECLPPQRICDRVGGPFRGWIPDPGRE